jgi:hypothetical protein
MSDLLCSLRRDAPSLTPQQFLAAHPGCHIQYFDDTPARNAAKALSHRSFDLATARAKQREQCAVCYSLQAFGTSRTKEQLLCYRNLGVDIDLLPVDRRVLLPDGEGDRCKDAYLRDCLFAFALRPHWLTETGSGFHAVFRIQPQRTPSGIAEAESLCRRLIQTLKGDPKAALLTQLLRVPGTLQFKDPARPFLCRLLVDNSAVIPPYPLSTVRTALDTSEALTANPLDVQNGDRSMEQPAWRKGLCGVSSGERNATATSLVGKILGRLPQDLWDIAGWGGLKEWNGRNTPPLPEQELRTVFESIARREAMHRHTGRQSMRRLASSPAPHCDG